MPVIAFDYEKNGTAASIFASQTLPDISLGPHKTSSGDEDLARVMDAMTLGGKHETASNAKSHAPPRASASTPALLRKQIHECLPALRESRVLSRNSGDSISAYVPARSGRSNGIAGSAPQIRYALTTPLRSSAHQPMKVKCSARVKNGTGRQCKNWVKIPQGIDLSNIDVIEDLVFFCYIHETRTCSAKVDRIEVGPAQRRRIYNLSDIIPQYTSLSKETKAALFSLCNEETRLLTGDTEGYIYVYEILRGDSVLPQRHFKVGYTAQPEKRLNEWQTKCNEKMKLIYIWPPPQTENSDTEDKGIALGKPCFGIRQIESMVHHVLADFVIRAPYLEADLGKAEEEWSTNGKKTPRAQLKQNREECDACGTRHQEIFSLLHPDSGPIKEELFEIVVKPIIENLGSFVRNNFTKD